MKPVKASKAALVWRLPLAAASMAVYKASGMLFRRAMARYNQKHPETLRRWRVISGDLLKMPIALPAIMSTGPRWNTHAIVATAGPLDVSRSFEIDPACALQSARSWSVVVCTFPGMETVSCTGSASVGANNQLPAITLGPGRYWLALRYYDWSDAPELPSVRVDGEETVPSLEVSPRGNDFYKELSTRGGFAYLAMHYYVWVLMRYPGVFGQRLITREYLPLGNPDTEFYFGCADAGESICIDLHAQVPQAHNVFLTVYSRASFPLLSRRISSLHEEIPAVVPCTYLIRVHRTGPGPFQRDWVTVTSMV